jgi:hypothetical protein
MLDHVADHLHDTEDALRNCCLVSKSWVPRARKHLFRQLGFSNPEELQLWKETFPDPSTSPARYTKTLFVGCSEVVTAADAEVGGWITGFSRVEHLTMGSWPFHDPPLDEPISLVPFHGFSHALKSLHVGIAFFPFPQFFDLLLSFPLIEDLRVAAFKSADGAYGFNEPQTAAQPSNKPTFTGSLKLNLERGMEPFIRRLLSLPGGIHFRKLILTGVSGLDPSVIMELVEGCSHTVESLHISEFCGTFIRQLRPH